MSAQIIHNLIIILPPLMRPKKPATIANGNSTSITAEIVPHRDEYSETAGFKIKTGNKTYLFIPDIDKWSKWQMSIIDEVKAADMALIDGTFFDSTELPGRNISEVPHPFVEESMNRFSALPSTERSKIRFIHFNHTNPLLKKRSEAKDKVIANGFGLAEEGMIIDL